MKAQSIAWLAAVALSISVAGCGGGNGNGAGSTTTASDQPGPPVLLTSPNSSGVAATFTRAGFIDQSNPFFKSLGNGRSCATCHQQNDGWSITPSSVQARFGQTGGNDPLFIAMDGANSPFADVSSVDAKRAAYSMLLTKGLIRMGLPIPEGAEFELVDVDDPYGFASSTQLSLFRRPLPATNLKFLSTVMWDARDTYKDANSGICYTGTTNCYSALDVNLARQANRAVLDHTQAAMDLTPEEQAAIVAFERDLFTAQIFDHDAKSLTGAGGKGGPLALADTDFYFGINDIDAGDYRTRARFNPRAMTLFNAWSATSSLPDEDTPPADAAAVTDARRAIARGQGIFNARDMFINNVSGMRTASIRGSCTTCHNAPGAGSHSTPLMVNIGVGDVARRTPDMPLYTLRNKATGATIQTTDPGVALLSGKWEEIGRFKVPVLRALASRGPYFHDGSAKDLREVVEFYNTRFEMKLSLQEISDLTAFLKAL
jgi:cytochrome c peroxidase